MLSDVLQLVMYSTVLVTFEPSLLFRDFSLLFKFPFLFVFRLVLVPYMLVVLHLLPCVCF